MGDVGRRKVVDNNSQQPARLFSSVDELLGNWDGDAQLQALAEAQAPPALYPPGRWQDYTKLNDLEKLTVLQRLELRRARARLKLAYAEE